MSLRSIVQYSSHLVSFYPCFLQLNTFKHAAWCLPRHRLAEYSELDAAQETEADRKVRRRLADHPAPQATGSAMERQSISGRSDPRRPIQQRRHHQSLTRQRDQSANLPLPIIDALHPRRVFVGDQPAAKQNKG